MPPPYKSYLTPLQRPSGFWEVDMRAAVFFVAKGHRCIGVLPAFSGGTHIRFLFYPGEAFDLDMASFETNGSVPVLDFVNAWDAVNDLVVKTFPRGSGKKFRLGKYQNRCGISADERLN
jgi:hypothetical protein